MFAIETAVEIAAEKTGDERLKSMLPYRCNLPVNAFPYLYRRFGPPNFGSDDYKHIASYGLETKMEGMTIVVNIHGDLATMTVRCKTSIWEKYTGEIGDSLLEHGEFVRTCHEVAADTIIDLLRPVWVRDEPIDVFGIAPNLDGDFYAEVEPFQFAGYAISHEHMAQIVQELKGEPMTNAEKVRAFYEATTEGEIPSSPIVPWWPTLRLREELIIEEYKEVIAATFELDQRIQRGEDLTTADIAPLMHELADLLYVTYGAMLCFGVDPDAVFAEVHEANMRKVTGPRREDGKLLKPEGWEPADVAAVIERLKGGA